MPSTNFVLTIGGFDPSSGAGITQDVKVFDTLDCPALAVQTCLTIQHESHIEQVYWHDTAIVLQQLKMMLGRYLIPWVKISLVKDLAQLEIILNTILQYNPDIKVVWDPVQTSSSGYQFNDQRDQNALIQILEQLYLVLPNRNEMKHWQGDNAEAGSHRLSAYTTVYLKGGHSSEKGTDIIYYKHGEVIRLEADQVSNLEKHGSGCVFSSAFIASLYQGEKIEEAAIFARRTVFDYLESSPGLLGTIRSTLNSIPVE